MNNTAIKTCTCPSCKSDSHVIDLFYGIPTLDTFILAKKGNIAIGGSDLWPFRFSHVCKHCSIEFDGKGNHQEWQNPFITEDNEANIAA